MLKDNEEIQISGLKAIEVLRELEYMLISLNKIARHYYDGSEQSESKENYIAYAVETTKFIDENKITRRLAKARRIISESFNDELGADDMGDIERAMEGIDFWKASDKLKNN